MSGGRDRLAARHAGFVRWGKRLLLGAFAVWALLIVAMGGEPTGYLLNTRLSFVARLLDVELLGQRFVWGGPTLELSLRALGYFVGCTGLLVVAWVRLVRGRWSRNGFLIYSAAVCLTGTALWEARRMAYPDTVAPEHFGDLLAKVERHRPGLVRRLLAGERPVLPHTGTIALRTEILDGGRGALTPDSQRLGFDETALSAAALLDDRDTVAGLRFALAERALAVGDRATLRRLLPLAAPHSEADLTARRNFAYRLTRMAAFAGVPAVEPGDQAEVARWARQWAMVRDACAAARPVMQALLLSGLLCLLFGWSIGRRLKRLDRASLVLAAAAPPPVRPSFGRRQQAPGSL